MARILRSWMFVPGNQHKFIDKAMDLEVDAVFLDLEDGVPPSEKSVARKLVAEALARSAGGPARYVRVNAVGSQWFEEDLAHVLVPGLEGICLPKVERAEEVREAARRIEMARAAGSRQPRIVVAIESALGLVNAPVIATSHSSVLALMMGAEDFALDLGLGPARDRESRELLFARSALVVAAATARLMSIDGVFPNLEDAEGLVAEVTQARRLGFNAKSTFNPRQVDVINRIFTPTESEIEYAHRVVGAFKEATARGAGSIALGGQLVDLPVAQRAQRMLDSVRTGPDMGGE